MKKMIDLVVEAVRANPARSLAWTLVLVIVFGVFFGLSDNLARQLYLFTQ
jgi:uncharacterized Rmd1/YagE family protein